MIRKISIPVFLLGLVVTLFGISELIWVFYRKKKRRYIAIGIAFIIIGILILLSYIVQRVPS